MRLPKIFLENVVIMLRWVTRWRGLDRTTLDWQLTRRAVSACDARSAAIKQKGAGTPPHPFAAVTVQAQPGSLRNCAGF